jgi:hypothetical protein
MIFGLINDQSEAITWTTCQFPPPWANLSPLAPRYAQLPDWALAVNPKYAYNVYGSVQLWIMWRLTRHTNPHPLGGLLDKADGIGL